MAVHYAIETGRYACGIGKRFSSQDITSKMNVHGVDCKTCLRVIERGRIYPCNRCNKLRTKDEGGTVFTVCEDCWEKKEAQLS